MALVLQSLFVEGVECVRLYPNNFRPASPPYIACDVTPSQAYFLSKPYYAFPRFFFTGRMPVLSLSGKARLDPPLLLLRYRP